MSSQRSDRAKRREDQENPQNITIIADDGGRKVLTWEEYQEFLKPKEPEEEVIIVPPKETN